MRAGEKPEDTFLYTFVYGKIAERVAVLLANIHTVSPNMLTCLSLISTILACLTLISETNPILRIFLTVALLQLSLILDCSDGALARLTHRVSHFGAWLDQVFDRINQFFMLLFISYYRFMVTSDNLIWIGGFFTLFMVYLLHYSRDIKTSVSVWQKNMAKSTILTRSFNSNKIKLNYFVPSTDTVTLLLSLGLVFNMVPLAYVLLSVVCGLYTLIRAIVSWRLIAKENIEKCAR